MISQDGRTISFEELHHHLLKDVYYGVESSATDAIVGEIHRQHQQDERYQGFFARFAVLPSKADKQRQLVYLWCSLMGLPAYRRGKPLEPAPYSFLENWIEDFQIRLNELRKFLRKHAWPLPVALFPEAADTTRRKVELDEAEYQRAFEQFVTTLPKLQSDLAEVEAIVPTSMTERRQKQAELERLQREVAAVHHGKTHDEAPEERRQRLRALFKQEEARNPRGALQRVANQEGITRQTLRAILDR